MILLTILAFFVIFTIVVLNSTTENSKNDEIMKKYNEIKKRNNRNITIEKVNQGDIFSNNLFDDINSTSDLTITNNNNYGSSFDINPASGLPMIENSMIDVDGNTYGSSDSNDI